MTDREKLKRWEWISFAVMLIGVALILIFSDNSMISLLGLAVIIGGLFLEYKTRICPHCGSSLWGVRFIPDYCPHCGKKIE